MPHDHSSSSGSYAFYSFPATPNRPSPAQSTRGPSQSLSPEAPSYSKSTRSSESKMAPTPAAGRAPKLPSTPTKTGKSPSSNTTPKLGQASEGAKNTAQDSAQQAKGASDQAKGASDQAKGATDQAKQSTPSGKDTSSPKPPPRPKEAAAASDRSKEESKAGAEDLTRRANEAAAGGKINLKDNDPSANEGDDEGPTGKVSQEGVDTGAEETTEGELESADPNPIDDSEQGEDAARDTKETAQSTTDDADVDEPETEDAEESANQKSGGVTGGVTKGAKNLAGKASGAKDTVSKAAGKAGQGDVQGAAQDTAEDAQEGAEDTAGDVQDTAAETAEGAKETAEDTAEGAKDTAEETAEGAAESAKDAAPDEAGDTADNVKESVEDGADQLPDLSILKGLKIGEGGDILDNDGNVVGKVSEGDPADLAGEEVGDGGEILDEDGDVIGRVETVAQEGQDKAGDAADEAKDTAEGAAETYLPDLDILKGLEVTESGEIFDKDGNAVGKISEGDPSQLAGQTLNEQGEVVDEDGDAIGRAETLPQPIKEATDEAQEGLPDLSALEGKKVGEDGQILDDEGNPIGKITEGEAADMAGKTLNEKGEIVNEDGEVVGKATTLEEEAKQNLPDISALEGLEVGENGDIVGPDGNVMGRIVEGDPADLAGQTLNEKGEVVDADGDAIGRAEVVAQDAKDEADGLKPDLSIIEGKKINKKGKILDEDGETLAQLTEDSDVKQCIGKIPNENGEILNDKGEVVGRVEIVPGEAADEAMKALHPELAEKGADAAEGAGEDLPDLSELEGYRVNKKGDVLNEDGEPIARLSEGELSDCAGKKLNDKGEVVDKDGNVLGKVEVVKPEAEGEGEDEGDELPPVSTLEGYKVNKAGYIVDEDGNPIGKLVEGDAKKLSKGGFECDAEGQFWDNRGHVIGRAETLPKSDKEEDAPFAGLEGLLVVKDGWVEDENGNRVGQLTEGDAKKLVGRAVDEDGDVIDKRGNVVGHAERYEEPEEGEAEKADLSILEGLAVNKQGNVIGKEGVPIARLVEGNPKELAGRKCDAEGQIWNDSGKVVGRCELIPENEREEKAEGPFGGLEGLVVVKGGWVEDEDGNRVGQVVEGDAKKLIGRAVDEDGDIIDKYGNVKGHAEPYEEPEEEEADLSALDGGTVNKIGNVVDANGNVIGRITSGDPKKMAGRKVDGKGQIWSDDGKVIGQAELMPGNEQQQGSEGPFAGFEKLVVGKDGVVQDQAGQIVGRLVEGDAKKLLGRTVDEDGEILDRNGNSIGKAERWEPEEKKRDINPMSGRKINKDGEVRDENGDLIGRLTAGNLGSLIGKEIDDNGYVVDNDGNKIGECTLIENIQDDEEEETEEERNQRENAEIAKKMIFVLRETIDKVKPVCEKIDEKVDKADRTPKDELDEQALVDEVKPLLEEGGKILQECNGAIRGLDPDGSIAATAKQRAASGEATKEEHQLAELLKELTTTVVKSIDNGKKRVQGMPHAKKKLNPLWYLMSEPLFQIIAAVGLLLSGVLGLVGRLLNGLGLGGLVNGLLGGLGIDKLLGGLGLGSISESLTGGGDKKKKGE